MNLTISRKTFVSFFLITVFFVSFLLISGCRDKGAKTRKPIMVNDSVPAFQLTDTGGRKWNLSNLKGNVVLINFWATWCPSCVEEMPSIHNLNVLASGADGFQILTILYQDSPEKATAYFKNEGFAMPILIDRDSKAAAMYGLEGIPATFIIDKKGILREKYLGPRKFDSSDIVKLLNDLLEEPS